MALQKFEPATRLYPPPSALSEAAQPVDPELRAMALGIQAWFDGAAEPLFEDTLRSEHQSKQKPTRQKRSQ